MEIDRHAEELASDLGVDKEEVAEGLRNLVEYSVPMEEAKQSLRRKYGGDSGGSSAPTSADLAEVTPDSGNVTVTAKVLTVGKRSIRYNGDDHVIFEGELADESGKISYTAWEDFGLEAGDVVRIGNAGVREYEGRPELNFGESSTVSVVDEPLEIAYEAGGEADLADLEAGDRGVTLDVRVVEVERKTIDGRDGETEILSGVLGDETARLPFTAWEVVPELTEEGASVHVENAYVREFRGVPSVNVSEFSVVTEREPVEVGGPTRMTIREAVSGGGAYDVELVGNVIEVRDGSGLIERCPECGRVIQKGQCRTHGDVEGEDDMRVKAILDDGTGTATAILDRELTEAVYGGTLEDALEAARDAMNREVVADDIRESVVGKEYAVRGHLSVDEYGANLETVRFRESDGDPAERAHDLLAEVSA
ncbi:Single-stranded DNA binding protein [Halarchaeum nitratireducens]|uniref:Replication protein A n=1 Tax=Halarchaeum nitratireducens TaxID=489913 RepID=A0A830GAC3_9EURY|nr:MULTISPECIES: Single-stranded DNA binding protein [Halarchaeum]MBP2250731.1 replication factor A1 [Halarchaeum solikamskense]GGN16423.1 replication protein A [Halarchaeum nitratireducens]